MVLGPSLGLELSTIAGNHLMEAAAACTPVASVPDSGALPACGTAASWPSSETM